MEENTIYYSVIYRFNMQISIILNEYCYNFQVNIYIIYGLTKWGRGQNTFITRFSKG